MVVAGVVSEFCLYDVDAGVRVVMFDQLRGGLQTVVIGEGTHFKIPGFQKPYYIDIRSRPKAIHSQTGTKDLQMVNISLRVLLHPDENRLAEIYRSLGPDFDERTLPSIGNEVLKAVVARYNAEELLSKREDVAHEIRDKLGKRAASFGLLLDDVSLTHLTFGKEFARAIENKQVAQQEAETQLYHVQRADQERRAAVIRAEGEAEAAALISNAMQEAGNGLIEVRRIDTAKEVAQTLARGRNIVYLPGSKAGGGGSNVLIGVGNDK